jgi:hypothetical protein
LDLVHKCPHGITVNPRKDLKVAFFKDERDLEK